MDSAVELHSVKEKSTDHLSPTEKVQNHYHIHRKMIVMYVCPCYAYTRCNLKERMIH